MDSLVGATAFIHMRLSIELDLCASRNIVDAERVGAVL